ncbi:hypothetical protein D932_02295 [Enterococcus casseliflavus 14-MB-W-14]|nr:hypothetical protein D932_02295 [Enterococcus casseliflavus 14-MB-W-14]
MNLQRNRLQLQEPFPKKFQNRFFGFFFMKKANKFSYFADEMPEKCYDRSIKEGERNAIFT